MIKNACEYCLGKRNTENKFGSFHPIRYVDIGNSYVVRTRSTGVIPLVPAHPPTAGLLDLFHKQISVVGTYRKRYLMWNEHTHSVCMSSICVTSRLSQATHVLDNNAS